jgi:hypothetical protein
MPIISLNLADNVPTYAYQELQRTRGGVEMFLQHSRGKEFVQHHLLLPQVFHMQDIKGQQLFGPYQQDQGLCGSTRLFGGTRKGRRHCHDLTRELTVVVRIFGHRHGIDVDERNYNGLSDNTFDA